MKFSKSASKLILENYYFQIERQFTERSTRNNIPESNLQILSIAEVLMTFLNLTMFI